MRPAHFPGRAPIDTYGNGGFRFADMSHRGSLLCLPSGIYGWHVETSQDITADTLSRLKSEEGVEVLLIGTGSDIVPLDEAARSYLSDLNIRCETMATGAAARTYNVLLAEGRAIAAALIAID